MPEQQETRLEHSVGEYRLVRILGGGGFGTVYLAEHVHEHTQVAVKLFHTSLSGSKDFKDFLNEARTIRLRHPHIVPLLDFSMTHDNLPFLVMEYAPQGTLRDCHSKGVRIPLSTVISYVDQIASALQYAHDQRVIHRDIKPANILVRADGILMVSDFGIAKFLEQSLLTSQEKLAGTPEYMAPEQHKGKPCKASDQYALAVVVYEWICGVRPFQGTLFRLAAQHINTPPLPPRDHVPELSEAVERVILKALAKVPEDRFAQIQAFADALRETVQLPPSGVVAGPAIEIDRTMPLILPEQVPLECSDLKLEGFMDAPIDTKSAHRGSVIQRTDVPALHQKVTSDVHSTPQDPFKNVTTLSLQKHARRSALPKRQRLALVFLFILMLVGGSSLGISAVLSIQRGTSQGQPVALSSGKSNQSTAPVQPSTNALGTEWHTQTSGSSQTFYGIAWSRTLSRFAAVGWNETIFTSPDGFNWTSQNSSTSQALSSIVWSDSQFVAVGNAILTSPDGISWTSHSPGLLQLLTGIAWSGSQFVAVGDNGTILTSPNGSSWTSRSSGTSQSLASIVWSSSRPQFVAVGKSGTILTSPDGIIWTPDSSGISYGLRGIAWSSSRSQFVAVGQSGTILTSPDGISWTPRSSGISPHIESIVWSDSQFVAVGDGGTVLTSPDGVTWTSQTSGISLVLWGIACSGSRLVAVGYHGTVLTSP